MCKDVEHFLLDIKIVDEIESSYLLVLLKTFYFFSSKMTIVADTMFYRGVGASGLIKKKKNEQLIYPSQED